jgi:hypothetical protein
MGKFRCRFARITILISIEGFMHGYRFAKPSGLWARPTCPLQLVLSEVDGKLVPVALRDMEDLPAEQNLDPAVWYRDHRVIVLEV